MRSLMYAGIVAAFMAGTLQAQGAVALSMGSTTPNGGNTVLFMGQTNGWEFSLSSAVVITNLGIFAALPATGLGEAHAIGVWDSSGNLLVSGTVPAGTAGTLLNSFFYVPVPNTFLPPGTYIIAAEYDMTNTDFMYANLAAASFSTASPVTFMQNEAGGNGVNVLTHPTFSYPPQEDGWFGPNFQFITHPPFFTGEVSLANGVYYLQFPDSNLFGYYGYLSGGWIYHFDLGYEYVDPGNGSEVYLWDDTSQHWWYTNASLFPYLYDFTLNAWLYYYPATNNAGHYTTNPRSFKNLSTNVIFTM